MPSTVEVRINGTKIPRGTVNGSLVVTQRLGQRQTADFAMDIGVKAGESVPVPLQGRRVEILEAGTTIFAGIIVSSKLTEVRAVAPGASFIKRYNVACLDYSWILDRRIVGEYTFIAKHASTIIRELIQNTVYLQSPDPFGFSDQIQTTSIANGLGALITRIEFSFPTVAEALNQIVAQSPGWRWRLDFARQLHFEQTNLSPGGADLVIDQSDPPIAVNSLTVDINRDRYANKIVGKLSKYETTEQTETFTGAHPTQPVDGNRRDWQLVYPVARTPKVRVNGAEQSVGIKGIDAAAFWLWEVGSRVVEKNDILSPPANGQTVEFVYVGYQQETVNAQDNAEIAARQIEENTSGIYERVVEINSVVANADAQAVADAELAKAKEQGKIIKGRTVWRTSADNPWRVQPGWTITVNRPAFPPVTGLVTEVTITDQGDKDHHFIRTFTAESGPRAANAVEFFSGSTASPIVGLSPAAGGAVEEPPAENPSAVSAFPIYDKDRWGVQGSVSFGANRASIKYCELVIDGPYDLANNVIAGQTRQQTFTTFVPPGVGNYSFTSDIAWLRSGSSQRFRVQVRAFNADEVFTAAPPASAFFTVDPVNITTQASGVSAFVFTTTATADGVEAWGIQPSWTQANDQDASHTEIWIEVWNGTAYKSRQLYTATEPGGSDNGFFQSSPGEIIDVMYSVATPVRVLFITITKDGKERPNPPVVSLTVFPGVGNLEGARLKNSSVTDTKIQSLQASKITAGTITASVSMTSPTLVITSGSVTVNIDSLNFVRVQNFALTRYTQMSGNEFRVQSTANSNNFTSMVAGQVLIQNNSAVSLALSPTNVAIAQFGSGGSLTINGLVILSQRRTGWGTPFGVLDRSAFDTSTVTLSQLASRVAALIWDLNANTGGHGLIG